MTKLSYSTAEILAEHPYARPHEEAGYRLHGGFDAAGNYISPRTLNRAPAIEAWAGQLKARGAELVDSSQALLVRGNYPAVAQHKFLLSHGMGQTLWNSLSVTGMIEARGLRLAQAEAPDFQDIIVEDISCMAIGHLNKGLLLAHGLDEGGDAAKGEGGHDAMWFAVRDLLFGENAYPVPAVPGTLGRPEAGRLIPQIPAGHEDWILVLMNLLMIEVRAENFFSACTAVMRDPNSFRDRREAAMHAAILVDRIRQDEAPHVGYLTDVMSELRSLTITTVDRTHVPGSRIFDPLWHGMVQWHTMTKADFDRKITHDEIADMLMKRANGAELLRRFDELEQKQAA